jgi:hypothetical protein
MQHLTPAKNEPLLTRSEVAKILGVTVTTLQKMLVATAIKGIECPFQPLNTYVGRGYTTPSKLHAYLLEARAVGALPRKLQAKAA